MMRRYHVEAVCTTDDPIDSLDSDADRFNGNESRDGESGRSGCSNFSRWCRSCILDVGHGTDWFIDSIH